MSAAWEKLQGIAQAEVADMINRLPHHLREKARALPVTLEPVPNDGWIEDGIAADSLGLFVGAAFAEEEVSSHPLPPQIILFLENLWDLSAGDETVYREELQRTFLHELGHYLGLDEDDLWERDLD